MSKIEAKILTFKEHNGILGAQEEPEPIGRVMNPKHMVRASYPNLSNKT